MKLLLILLFSPLALLSQTDTSKCFFKVCDTLTNKCDYIKGYEVLKETNGGWERIDYLDESKKRIRPKRNRIFIYIESMM